jgi:serine/threonine protein kinase
MSYDPPEDALFEPPRKVLIDIGQTTCFFKSCDSTVQTTNELRAYKQISAANFDPQLHICRLHGVVMNDIGSIAGLLLSYIDHGGHDLSARVGPSKDDPPASVRIKWANELNDAITELHTAGIVWGDVKAENVLVDKDDNAWITDFGGGYTLGWVDKELAGTVEGDLAGMEKIREFIFQDGSKDTWSAC